MLARRAAAMSNRTLAASQRTRAIAQHMHASTDAAAPAEPPVKVEQIGQMTKYILNRPDKLNALNTPMLDHLHGIAKTWSKSELSRILVGTGVGRAFCAGGDVATVVELAAKDEESRQKAIDFFKREFELDYLLAAVPNPYVAFMDGITMGGGVGLSANATFRVATEKTVFAMPETKIGYCPDVGATFFLARLDGEIGTYLGLTGESIKGRDVYDLGLATHYIPSRRIPGLIEKLAALDRPSFEAIDNLIEECAQERETGEPACIFSGEKRAVLDSCFRHDKVEDIISALKEVEASHANAETRTWARETLDALELRSPTSLKVALIAIRKGSAGTLHTALQRELNIATAFCHSASPDFQTGVRAVLMERLKGRPAWSPATVAEVDDTEIATKFFGQYSPENGTAPSLEIPEDIDVDPSKAGSPMRFALPTEEDIRKLVTGSHPTSGSSALTKADLLRKLDALRKGKMGVREKALDVAARKCIESPPPEDPKGDVKYLYWRD